MRDNIADASSFRAKRDRFIAHLLIFAIVALMFLCCGCGPYQKEVSKEVRPNETAFLIPLEGGAGPADGVRFDSAEYLNARKVAAKRVVIPTRQRSLGRAWFDYEWIPTALLVVVDRTPVTREWSSPPDGTSSTKDDTLHMETKDSIGFRIGATVTAHVEEADAASFLYNYSGKALADVIDTEVRSFVQSELMHRFGAVDLSSALTEKGRFVREVVALAQQEFRPRGVSIDFLGMQDGLEFDNPKIQDTLDRKFVAENEKQIAIAEANAQSERNRAMTERAEGEKAAASISAASDRHRAEEVARGEAFRAVEAARAEAEATELRVAANLSKAKAEAEAKRLMSFAMATPGADRVVEMERWSRWDGKLPMWNFGTAPVPVLTMPLPVQAGK